MYKMLNPPKPFSAQQAQSNPSLLTQYSKSHDVPYKFYEGRVGNVFADQLVTTPNMNILYEPPINLRKVRLRRDNHFGSDDPLFYPQPFDRQAAFRVCIRVEYPDPTLPQLDTAFKISGVDDFVKSPSFRGIGCLHRALLDRFITLTENIFAKFPIDAPKKEPFIAQTSIRLRRMLARLDSPASRSETFFRFAYAQRQVLYLLARYEWVYLYRPKYEGMSRTDPPAVNPTIVGAFAAHDSEADNLFHAGIPVWYSRRLSDAPGVRIDHVEGFLSEAIEPMLGQRAELRSSTSVIRSLQFSSPSAIVPFGFYQLQAPASLSRSIPPYSGRPNKSKSNVGNNTFVEQGPLFPPSASAWSEALQALSHHNISTPPPPGCNCGYWLPPPRIFVNCGNPEKQISLLRNWLKIRDVTIFQLSTGGARMSSKEWRAWVELGGRDTSRITNSKSGQQQQEVHQCMDTFLATHNLGIEYSKLAEVPALWKGKLIPEKELPLTRVVHEILYELGELAFRQELVVLDEKLDTSQMEQQQRDTLLEDCWVGERFRVSGYGGLGGETVEARLPYLQALRTVMLTWRGNRPLELLDGFPTEKAVHNFRVRCELVEKALASFYTSSFLLVFGREAMVPHSLST
ncbi:hypothetical protein V5O48_015215 [Marasmius crinis-equi]|uniref:Uncharacterized protein n=1 Tax=Marasmius crinis-equi TaxID=585013 RepID=A0ABR3EV52_9AGAR